MRRTALRQRGRRGSAFPHRRDPDYWRWLGEELELGPRCDGCGKRRATCRSHLVPRGRGGDDRYNIALLCFWCDRASEKRVDRWMAEHPGVNLYAKAAAHTAKYDRYKDLPF